jgi:hypothetical protein
MKRPAPTVADDRPVALQGLPDDLSFATRMRLMGYLREIEVLTAERDGALAQLDALEHAT